MRAVVVGLLLAGSLFAFPLHTKTVAAQQQGDPQAGAGQWRARYCVNCHGNAAEGGFGPDLAGGRGLTLDQVRRAIRKPWGVMPSYTEEQLSDQQIADVFAFLQSRPTVAEPGEWHWPQVPASAPLGQRLYMNMAGCGQCHEPENKFGRMWLGERAKEVNYEYFAKMIYNHTDKYPAGGMGNFNPERVPEFALREIYKFHVEDLGMRASIGAGISIGDLKDGLTTYTINVTNRGVQDLGLDAEGMTVFVRLAPGTKVAGGTGPGYKGVQPLAELGLQPAIGRAVHPNDDGVVIRPEPDLSRDVIVWKIPKVAAGDKVTLTFTLEGAPSAELIRGFDGSTVHWENPGRTAFGQRLAYRDTRTPDFGDHERIGVPRLPAPPRPAAAR